MSQETSIFIKKGRGRSRSRSQTSTTRRSRSRSRSRAPSRMMRLSRRKPLALVTHNFTERVIEEYNLPVNGSGLFQTFALQDVYNTASYQKLFEYYKINKVIITLRYKAAMQSHQDSVVNANPGTQSVNEVNPIVWFKVDHNDVAAQSLSEMKSSTRTKEIQFTNNNPKIQIVLKPAIQEEAYKSSVQSTYIPKWGQWLTTGDPTVPHYGIKMYATGPAAASSGLYGSIVVEKQYYFSCKNNE